MIISYDIRNKYFSRTCCAYKILRDGVVTAEEQASSANDAR